MKYRSKQEQKWAKFFDLIGLKYVHNPDHIRLDNDFCYSPSFYLPEIDLFYIEGPEKAGAYFDVIGNDDLDHWSMSRRVKETILIADQLPISSDEDAYALTAEQLVNRSFTFMKNFDSIVIAEPHYHTMKQERWIEDKQFYEKDRMMIPFYEAQKAENEVG